VFGIPKAWLEQRYGRQKLDRLLEALGPVAISHAAGEISSVVVAQIAGFPERAAVNEIEISPCQSIRSSFGCWRKRRLGFDQSLRLKLGPEFGRDFRLQRIVVLGDLLRASRPDDKSDRDIWRCRELKRSGS
jgi:hypothetical protein